MTKIQWTDETWNPVTGCTRVSAGCDHCYASALHNRRYRANVRAAVIWSGLFEDGDRHIRGDEHWVQRARRVGAPSNQTYPERLRGTSLKLPFPDTYDTPFAVVRCHPERLEQPLHWRKPRRVFTCSMGDLFHKDVPATFLSRVFETMEAADWHTFQVLTKRPQWMWEYMRDAKPLPNVWLGVSAENQRTLDARVPILLDTPAALRFVSLEPLLGPVNLRGFFCDNPSHDYDFEDCPRDPAQLWVICGGESGPRARPCDVEWLRDIVRQCRAAGVPVFVKQLGSRPYMGVCPECGRDPLRNASCPRPDLPLRHPQGGNPDEWPEDLRSREFPEVGA